MSEPLIPQYFVGRNVSLCSVTELDVDDTGAVTLGTAYSLTNLGVFKSMTFEAEQNIPDIHPGDAIISNYQPGVDDFTTTIEEIRDAGGNSNLANAYFTSMYFRAQAQASYAAYGTGSPSQGPSLAVLGIRQRIGFGYQEGESMTTMVLKPCGISPYFGIGTPPF